MQGGIWLRLNEVKIYSFKGLEYEAFTGKKFSEEFQRHLGLLLLVDFDPNNTGLSRSRSAIREVESDICEVLVA